MELIKPLTKGQIKKLDRLWQKKVLTSLGGRSVLGGMAEVAHHFKTKGAHGFYLRWYIPNGIPLTNEQHQRIHGKDGKMIEDEIYEIKGQEWSRGLSTYCGHRKTGLLNPIRYEDVIRHLNGEIKYY